MDPCSSNSCCSRVNCIHTPYIYIYIYIYIYKDVVKCPAQYLACSECSVDGVIITFAPMAMSVTQRCSQISLSHPTPISCALDLYFPNWLWNISTLMFCKRLRLLFKAELFAFPQYLLFMYSLSQLKHHHPFRCDFWTLFLSLPASCQSSLTYFCYLFLSNCTASV